MKEKEAKGISIKIMVLYTTLAFIIVNILVGYLFLTNYKQNMLNEIITNIQEYEEVDLSHICQMFECQYIENNAVKYKNINLDDIYVRLVISDHISTPHIQIMQNTFLNNEYNFLFKITIEGFDGYITVDKMSILNTINNPYYFLLVSFMTSNAMFLLYNFMIYRRAEYKRNIMMHYDGYNKSMMSFTENLNHELNTPLAVIKNKIQKLIEYDNNSCRARCPTKTDISLKDYETVNAALSQITDLLARMRPFKDVRYQNHRDIGNVIRIACDMMFATQPDKFDYTIDDELYKLILNSKFIKNGELTAVVLNFVKNSVEANACNVQFKYHRLTDGYLTLYVTDDGNGIPVHVQKHVFKENRSTKSEGRGNGLSVNKFLLTEATGNVSIKYSSTSGTIFEVIVPVETVE